MNNIHKVTSQYKLLEQQTAYGLSKLVSQYLQDGFSLYDGPFTHRRASIGSDDTYYCQAVLRVSDHWETEDGTRVRLDSAPFTF